MTTTDHIERNIFNTPERALTPQRRAQLDTLTNINLDDMLRGVGLEHARRGAGLLRRLLRGRAQHFARKIIYYDDLVGARGLATGGAWAVAQFAERLHVVAQAHVPRSGAALIVANHPGLCDTVALFAAIDRPDLLILAAHRPFLHVLPHTSRHLLYVDDTQRSRVAAARATARHLRSGGAVLTFPGGQIEPDPAAQPDAAAALDRWGNSVAAFARFASDAVVVPTIVSGVVSPAALRHPLTRIRRHPNDRQWLAGLLQLQLRSLQHVAVRVHFGQPLAATQPNINDAVHAEAQRLIADAASHRAD